METGRSLSSRNILVRRVWISWDSSCPAASAASRANPGHDLAQYEHRRVLIARSGFGFARYVTFALVRHGPRPVPS